MSLKKILILFSLCFIVLIITFCSRDRNKIRDFSREALDSGRLYAYEVYDKDETHYLVGYGEWDKDIFVIRDIDGRIWKLPSGTKVVRGYVSEESFKRRTKP